MSAEGWEARNKTDLMIEVWEKLDCESVGRVEIEAIEEAVIGQYGASAADPPMTVARLLADEGAVLRHHEILEMAAQRKLNSPYDPMLRNLTSIDGFKKAGRSLKHLENLRKKLESEGDAKGLGLIRQAAIEARDNALELAAGDRRGTHGIHGEIAEWYSIWLQSPEVFENWIELRRGSKEFKDRFAPETNDDES